MKQRLSQRCQPIAALLFAVRSIQTPSCTDMPCRWTAPTQGHSRLLTKPLADITFKKHIVSKTVPAKRKRRLPPANSTADHSDYAGFAKKIAEDAPHLVWNRYSTSKPAPSCNKQGTTLSGLSR
ncbi:hypothetical protein V5799_029743 [Amblyomma americanum]|uniref:Uncharacterized protein n=1 Tax=Amblyomma americanum TaxID=6943 RepID=A0AAQ4EQQ0_AMBAM